MDLIYDTLQATLTCILLLVYALKYHKQYAITIINKNYKHSRNCRTNASIHFTTGMVILAEGQNFGRG